MTAACTLRGTPCASSHQPDTVLPPVQGIPTPAALGDLDDAGHDLAAISRGTSVSTPTGAPPRSTGASPTTIDARFGLQQVRLPSSSKAAQKVGAKEEAQNVTQPSGSQPTRAAAGPRAGTPPTTPHKAGKAGKAAAAATAPTRLRSSPWALTPPPTATTKALAPPFRATPATTLRSAHAVGASSPAAVTRDKSLVGQKRSRELTALLADTADSIGGGVGGGSARGVVKSLASAFRSTRA